MYHPSKSIQVTHRKRSVGVVRKKRSYRVQVAQAATGALSGLTAVLLILGFVIARLTTSTRYSTGVVLTTVAVAGGLVGGFILAPFINGLVSNEVSTEDLDRQREDWR
jgi:hypothetical protein